MPVPLDMTTLPKTICAVAAAGRLVTTLAREISGLDAAGLREAHAIVASGRSIGKVVVSR